MKHPKDYTPGHILVTILHAGDGSVSRAKLQKLLGLGEGSVKSMVKCMKKHGLISTSASGSRLTGRGIGVFKRVRLHVPELRKTVLDYLSVGRVNYTAVLRNMEPLDALKIRDMAVRLGGSGAVLLSLKEGCLKIPYVAEDLRSVSAKDYEELSKMSLKEKDSILIVGGDDDCSALGAMGSIILELLTRQA
jgi:DNA-binding MarR family transcriptional regulator